MASFQLVPSLTSKWCLSLGSLVSAFLRTLRALIQAHRTVLKAAFLADWTQWETVVQVWVLD